MDPLYGVIALSKDNSTEKLGSTGFGERTHGLQLLLLPLSDSLYP